MEKPVQHFSARNYFTMLLLIILITALHYSRYSKDSMPSASQIQKNTMVTSTAVGIEAIEDPSPLRVLISL
jgi:hypothetical protein